MKYRHWLIILFKLMIITGPFFLGFYGFTEMLIVGIIIVAGGIGIERLLLSRPMELLFRGDYFMVGQTGKGLTIRTPEKEEIIRKMLLRIAFASSDGGIRKITPAPEKVTFDEPTGKVTVTYSMEGWEANLLLTLKKDQPSVQAEFIFKSLSLPDSSENYEESKFILEYISLDVLFPWYLPVKELFLKNRTRRKRGGLFPVWLDKQGLTVGNRQQSFHLYHTPMISSLKYQRWPHKLNIFIDHVGDHRFVSVSGDEEHLVYHDESHTILGLETPVSGRFSFCAGFIPPFQPLLWIHAQGHDATLIWTEHPDNNRLETSLAVAFGDSRITPDDQPVGGFAYHQIPVTKGVFYTTNNQQNISLFNHPDSEAYRYFVDQLYSKYGYEITLHTASSHTIFPDHTEEALDYLKSKFHNVNWIDHSAHVRPETLSGQGRYPGSSCAVPDFLQKYGIKYAWHYGSELKYLSGYDMHDDARGLNLLPQNTGVRAGRHTPLYWRHPSRLRHLITWKSMVLGRLRHFPVTGFQWLVWFLRHLPTLVKQHGVCIIHDYPAWHYEKKYADGNGIYLRIKDHRGERFVIDPHFDQLLKHLAGMNSQGSLHLTTVQKFLDYQCALEKLVFDFHPPHRLEIINTGDDKLEAVLAFREKFSPSGPEWLYLRDSGRASLYKLRLEGKTSVWIDFLGINPSKR